MIKKNKETENKNDEIKNEDLQKKRVTNDSIYRSSPYYIHQVNINDILQPIDIKLCDHLSSLTGEKR